MRSSDVKWHEMLVSREDRTRLSGFQNRVLWFTGLSGSGKSSLAALVERKLNALGVPTFLLDGDNVRHGLNGDLGFSVEDRHENIRRLREVVKLFYDAGITVLVSFISPYRADRDAARSFIGDGFVEVFVDCPLSVCESRDVKGLYAKARAGEIKGFTGIDDPYEEPINPGIVISTAEGSLEENAEELFGLAKEVAGW